MTINRFCSTDYLLKYVAAIEKRDVCCFQKRILFEILHPNDVNKSSY